ncbi:hypothetical protein B0H11DRAFT_1945364 [Mycena galericulata]|nr:hypothetical protein B0H11DRAFT_1945364 [Mycena galericulata]
MIVSNVCRLWRRIVQRHSVFWSSISVNRTQTIRHIDYLLARSRSYPFHLLIDFRPAPYNDGPWHDPPLPAIVNRLLPHFDRLLSLVVYAGSSDILSIMRYNRALLHMPALTSLFVHRGASALYPTPVALFPSLSTSLHTMVLSVLPFDIASLVLLPNLQRLVLRDFSPDDYPSFFDFIDFLRSTPCVRELSLDRFGLHGVPTDESRLHLLPDLRVLHLALHSNASVVCFLSRLQLPSLVTLAVSFTSVMDSTLLLSCPTLLERTSIVLFDGRAPPLSALVAFIPLFSSVREFHAPYIGYPFFRALRLVIDNFASRPNPRLIPFPALVHLGLGCMTMAEAISYLAIRPCLSPDFAVFTFWFSVVIEIEFLPELTALLPDVRIVVAYPVAARLFSRVGLRE